MDLAAIHGGPTHERRDVLGSTGRRNAATEYTLFYRDEAVGRVVLTFEGDVAGGILERLDAFGRIRRRVSDASRAFSNLGFLPPGSAVVGGVSAEGKDAGYDAMAEWAGLMEELELRDAAGAPLATESIQVRGDRAPGDPVVVFIELKEKAP